MTKPKIKITNFRLFFFAAVCLVCGILISSAMLRLAAGTTSAVFLVLLANALAILLFLFFIARAKNSSKRLLAAGVCLALFLFSCDFVLIKWWRWQNAPTVLHIATISGVIEEGFEIDLDEGILNARLKNVRVNDEKYSYKLRVQIQINNQSLLKLVDCGSRITLNSAINNSEFFNSLGFVSYQAIYGVRGYAEGDCAELIKADIPIMTAIRRSISQSCAKWLGERQGAVAAGMLIGDMSSLDGSIRHSFSVSGVAHILSVSGVHIQFLAIFIASILKRFKLKRAHKAGILAVLVGGFVGICRFVFPACRSAITAILSYFAKASGERNDPFSNLCFAAIVLLVVNPLAIYDAGFLLSFIATLTILFFAPVFLRLFKATPLRSLGLSRLQALSVCVAAQVGVSVTSIFLYNTFSTYSIIANFVLMPLFSVVFVLLFVFCAVALALPFMGFLISLAYPLLVACTLASDLFSDLPSASIVIYNAIIFFIPFVVLLFIYSRFCLVHKKARRVVAVLLTIVCAASILYQNIGTTNAAVIAIKTQIGVADLAMSQTQVFLIGDMRDSNIELVLQKHKVGKIDACIPSNLSEDALSKMSYLIAKYNIKSVYMPRLKAELDTILPRVSIIALDNNVATAIGDFEITAHVLNQRVAAYAYSVRGKRVVSLYSQAQSLMQYLESVYKTVELIHAYAPSHNLPTARLYMFNQNYGGNDLESYRFETLIIK